MKKAIVFIIVALMFLGASCTPTAIESNANKEFTPEVTEHPISTTPEPSYEKVENKEMTLSFAFGDKLGTYTGEFINGLPNGYGQFITKGESGENVLFEGVWQDGNFTGYNFFRTSQRQYEGFFKNGVAEGNLSVYNTYGNKLYEALCKDGKATVLLDSYVATMDHLFETVTTKSYEEYSNNTEELIGEPLAIVGTVFLTIPAEQGKRIAFSVDDDIDKMAFVYIENLYSDDPRIVEEDFFYSLSRPYFNNGDELFIIGILTGSFESDPVIDAIYWNFTDKIRKSNE